MPSQRLVMTYPAILKTRSHMLHVFIEKRMSRYFERLLDSVSRKRFPGRSMIESSAISPAPKTSGSKINSNPRIFPVRFKSPYSLPCISKISDSKCGSKIICAPASRQSKLMGYSFRTVSNYAYALRMVVSSRCRFSVTVFNQDYSVPNLSTRCWPDVFKRNATISAWATFPANSSNFMWGWSISKVMLHAAYRENTSLWS